jgi:Amt family ammonium transporter
MYLLFGKPDPSMMCNGFLAGLVAITAPCAFVTSLGAVIIGAVAGVLVIAVVFFVERTLRIDDPVGAIAVHGANGFWGVISLGLFANGSYGAGWGGVHKLLKDGQIQVIVNDAAPATIKKYNELTAAGWADQGVTGAMGTLFGAGYNDNGQLLAEFIGAMTNVIVIGLLALVWFKLSDFIFPLRPSREDEIKGVDIPEMGAEAYPDYQLTDRSSPHID